MQHSEFKREIKVKIMDSYTKRPLLVGAVGILIGPVIDDIMSVQHNGFPHEIGDKAVRDWEVELKWIGKRHCRIHSEHLKIVGDERTCVKCLKSKVRQPTPGEVPLDHHCWSCKDE